MLRPRILVAVCSCEKGRYRRHVIRHTWAADKPSEIGVIFFTGELDTGEPNTWFLSVDDSYDGLTLKSRAMLEKALTVDWDYLFKVDDDSLVRLDRLHTLIPPKGWDLVGNEFLLDQQFASGGAGYLLSRAAVEIVVADDSRAHLCKMEDVAITQTAISNGVKYLYSYRLNWQPHPCPSPDNDLITCHHVGTDEMQRIHRQFQCAP